MHRPSSSISVLLVMLLLLLGGPGISGIVDGSSSGKHNSSSGCGSCHGSAGGVTPSLSGVPIAYIPGQTYSLTIGGTGGPTGSEGGFSLSTSSGSFSNPGNRVKISGSSVTHSNDGARQWTVSWTAPGQGSGSVTFQIAVNFVDGDGSQGSGDDWGHNTYVATEGAPSNDPPVASNVQITTTNPSKATGLAMSYVYSDGDGDAESGTTIVWSRDGSSVAAHDGQTSISGGSLNRDEVWTVTVTPHDGTDAGNPVTSSSISVGNSPPSVTNVGISPDPAVETDALTLTYSYSDLDGDSEGSTQIRWTLDDVAVAEMNDATMVSSLATRSGDSWRATVTPVDNQGDAGPIQSSQTIQIGSSNVAPTISGIGFSNANAATEDDLVAVWTYHDDDSDPQAKVEIEWSQNDINRTDLDDQTTIPASETSRGETWSFRIRVGDGLAMSDWTDSPDLVVANTAPTISEATISNSDPTTSTNLTLSWEYDDVDGDQEALASITWLRNGIAVSAHADLAALPASATKRGESWSAQISTSDGSASSPPMSTQPIVIGNELPAITNLTISSSSEGQPDALHPLTVAFAEGDADGDAISTTLEWKRDGFTVSALANLTTVPAEYIGVGQRWTVVVVAMDGFDGKTSRESGILTITNIPPAADFTAPPTLFSDTEMTLDGGVSSDTDGSIVAWFWNISGVRYSGERIHFTLPAGTVVVNLTVLDSDGGEASIEQNLEVVAGATVTEVKVVAAEGLVTMSWKWSGAATNFTIWRTMGSIDGSEDLANLEPIDIVNGTTWSEPLHVVGTHGYAVTVELDGSENLRIDAASNAMTIDLASSNLPTDPSIEGESSIASALVSAWLLLAALGAIGLALLDKRRGSA